MIDVERLDELGQDEAAEMRSRADRDRTACRCTDRANRFESLIERLKDRLRGVQEDTPGGCQINLAAATRSIDQRRTHNTLECADVTGDSGLRHEEAFRCLRETAFTSYRHKDAKLMMRDGCHRIGMHADRPDRLPETISPARSILDAHVESGKRKRGGFRGQGQA